MTDDLPAADLGAELWAAAGRHPVLDRRTEQAWRDWAKNCRALYENQVAIALATGTDVAWPAGPVKWIRVSDGGTEVTRAGNTIKRHTAPQRSHGRRHPKT